MSSNTDEAKAALKAWQAANPACKTTDARDAKQWTAAQSLVPTRYNGNTYYVGGNAVNGGSKDDPAGTIAVFFTGDCGGNPTSLFSLRGACANPQEEMWTPVTPQTNIVIKHVITYVPPTKPVCTQPNNCKPVNDCVTNPNQDKCKPVKDCVTNPEQDKCKPDNCVTNPNQDKCKPKDDCVTNPNQDKCKQNPPKVCNPDPTKLCAPQNPATNQPVGDNGTLDDPTPGVTPGQAEDVTNHQPNCQGASCTGDTNVDGTHVDNSDMGGGTPAGTGTASNPQGNNANSDGSANTPGTGAGTSSDTTGSTAHTGASDTDTQQGDPGSDLNLENVNHTTVAATDTGATADYALAA